MHNSRGKRWASTPTLPGLAIIYVAAGIHCTYYIIRVEVAFWAVPSGRP